MSRQLGPPPPTSPSVSHSMRWNIPEDTGPERALRVLLQNAGLRGYRLHWKKAPGRPDVAYPGRKVAIFVNGCFWHRCPRCQPPVPKSNSEFWVRKFQLNKERDQRKQTELERAGWTVLTVWECELKDDPGDVVRRVASSLRRAV